MYTSRAGLATIAVLLLFQAGCGPGQEGGTTVTADSLEGEVAMFRGDPQHTGVYDTPAPHHSPQLRWAFPTMGPVRSSPAVAAGRVFFGSGDGHLYALDAESGESVWKFATEGPVHGSPAVAEGMVYVTSQDRRLYAVDGRSGEERWRFEGGEELPFRWGWDYYLSSPVVADGVVYVGSGDGHLYALDAQSGDEKWRFKTSGRVRSSPALDAGRVYFGSMDGRLYAVDAQTGEAIWTFDSEGAGLDSEKAGFDRTSVQSSPAIGADAVVLGARDGFLYAVSLADGRERWRFNHKVSWVVSSPALFDGTAFAGSSDGFFLQGVDLATGEERWRTKTPSNVFSSPAIAGGVVYFGCFDGVLYALDSQGGAERWRFRTAGSIMSSPAVAEGVVYFGSDDGHLYAVSGTTTPDPERLAAKKAVFWEEVEWSWFKGGPQVRDFFKAEGYRVVDGAALAEFMTERVADRQPSVIVFALDVVPPAVTEPSEEAIFWKYLDAGGKIVWLGLSPLAVKVDAETGKPVAVDVSISGKLFGVNHEGVPFDEVGSTATPDGTRWGIDPWWISSQSVAVDEVTTVLGRDEHGRASAWVKSYGGPEGTGFVRLWGRPQAPDDLAGVKAVAEFGVIVAP
ncbi:MAG: PQQ-binding-like beta-propeller repeat protein [bacterium]|nr:PQQ-binding-like beta-propeller repeat protein [bacterium]